MIELRPFKEADIHELITLFYDTVHCVNAKDYNEEQLNAWANGKADVDKWNQSFLEHYTLVAWLDNEIVGFGDITKQGYLDRLYVHKNYQGRGIASAICDKLESHVHIKTIETNASITAKPFFLKRGYEVVKEQSVIRNNVALTNYRMVKKLKCEAKG